MAAPATNAHVPLTKVFVGNLSFKTKEDELAAEFSAAGKVKNANIITRGPRSLGYGFVEMETEEDAKKAVELMNKKSIDSREINVELAKPRDESAAAAPKTRGGGRGRGRGRGRGGRGRGRGAPVGGSASPVPASNHDAQQGEGAPRRRRFPVRRRPQVPRPNTQRTPSKTHLFVANLPFSVDDEKLAEIFKGLKVKSAHVVRKKNSRSKGFAFVEFENEADQQEALKAVEKKVVEGRELIVKVALTEVKSEGEQKPAGEAKTEAKPEEKKD